MTKIFELREDMGIGNPCQFKGVNKIIEKMTKKFFKNFYSLREDEYKN